MPERSTEEIQHEEHVVLCRYYPLLYVCVSACLSEAFAFPSPVKPPGIGPRILSVWCTSRSCCHIFPFLLFVTSATAIRERDSCVLELPSGQLLLMRFAACRVDLQRKFTPNCSMLLRALRVNCNTYFVRCRSRFGMSLSHLFLFGWIFCRDFGKIHQGVTRGVSRIIIIPIGHIPRPAKFSVLSRLISSCLDFPNLPPRVPKRRSSRLILSHLSKKSEISHLVSSNLI